MRYVRFEIRRYFHAGGHLYANALAGVAYFEYSQEIMWQDPLDKLGNAVEHLPNVENIGQSAEEAIKHLKIRRDIARMLWPIRRRFPKPHGRALYA